MMIGLLRHVLIVGAGIALAFTTASSAAAQDSDFAGCKADQQAPVQMLDFQNADGEYDGLNTFARECLNFRRLTDYNTTSLAIALNALSASGEIEVAPAYTVRWQNGTREHIRTSYLRLRAGIRAATGDDDKSARLFDLDEFQLAKGVGGIVGIEYGRSASRTREDTLTSIASALKSAKKDCLADHISETAAYDVCSGQALSVWMGDVSRRNRYFDSILKPLWGYDALPLFYGGMEFAYAKPEFKFLPLTDPAMTGYPLITTLPSLPGGQSKERIREFHIKAYIGGAKRANDDSGFGGAMAVSYRRDALYVDDTKNQTICPPATGFYGQCYDLNIAPPYVTEGWSISAQGKILTPRYGFLPHLGAGLKVSYAFDIDQVAGEVPLYLFTDDKGMTSGGVRIGCSSDGRTANGYKIEGECNAAVFVGTKFDLSGKP